MGITDFIVDGLNGLINFIIIKPLNSLTSGSGLFRFDLVAMVFIIILGAIGLMIRYLLVNKDELNKSPIEKRNNRL